MEVSQDEYDIIVTKLSQRRIAVAKARKAVKNAKTLKEKIEAIRALSAIRDSSVL